MVGPSMWLVLQSPAFSSVAWGIVLLALILLGVLGLRYGVRRVVR